MNFIYAFLILLAVITIHEFGHFIAAKISGVKVYEFAIGMGPKIYTKQGKETLFSIRALPLGGFCRLDNEAENLDDVEYNYSPSSYQDFENTSPIKKIFILISGVLFNFLTALIVLLFLFQLKGYPSTTVKSVIENSVAEESEILPGDKIVKINEKNVDTASELMGTDEYKSGEYDLTIIRNNEEITKHIKTTDGKIGIYFDAENNFLMSIKLSFKTIGLFIKEILKALGALFTGNSKNLMGVVGFVATVGTIQGLNLEMILMIVVNISISLAVFNLIPIVPLDGGHILITAIEGITKKKLSDRIKNIITMIGLSFVLYIFIRSLMNDFTRF